MPITKPLAAALTAAGLALGTPALAQTTDAPAPSAASFDEQKLDAFVTAALAVSEIQQSAQEELATAESAEAQQQVIEEANEAIVAAIEGTPGITLDEYIEIGEAAEADPELSETLTAMLVERGLQ